MDWIREHLQLILVVAGAIAVWLNNRQREKQGLPPDYDEDGVPDVARPQARPEVRELAPVSRDGTDPEQDERVRRIQEEIRRKIAERRGQAGPPTLPPAEPRPGSERQEEPFRPVFQETPPPLPRPAERPRPVSFPVEEDIRADAAALERQRALAQQLERLEERRREAVRAAAVAARGDQPVGGSLAAAAEAGVAGEPSGAFRDPRALRRALVWREVLNSPVALR